MPNLGKTLNISILESSAKDDKQIVYGAVAYANVMSHSGHYFTKQDLIELSLSFMRNLQSGRASIDTNHTKQTIDAYVVESFITADELHNNTDYPSNAWVVGIKIEDPKVWEQVKAKYINSFSATFTCHCIVEEVEVESPTILVGQTELSEGHAHTYIIKVDPETGHVESSTTSVTNGHSHDILNFGATQETDGHVHRFFTSY